MRGRGAQRVLVFEFIHGLRRVSCIAEVERKLVDERKVGTKLARSNWRCAEHCIECTAPEMSDASASWGMQRFAHPRTAPGWEVACCVERFCFLERWPFSFWVFTIGRDTSSDPYPYPSPPSRSISNVGDAGVGPEQ
mmetsp:Transcript_2673/g.7668  ORF Transcript_2673/g.7668 Transcript_2673/m.7668 type:complete len:137 (-) Transcript_2673:75-485(-)